MSARTNRLARRSLDQRLRTFGPAEQFLPPPKGWIKAMRDALGMSQADLAARLGIAAASVADLERTEASRKIKLETLARAADAMECDVVYAFIPRIGLERTVEQAARAKLGPHLAAVERTMQLEDQASTLDHESVEEEVRRLIESGQVWK
ncbi:MAG: mobile mystery protein A [Jatrophihabitantaceae bacterium]